MAEEFDEEEEEIFLRPVEATVNGGNTSFPLETAVTSFSLRDAANVAVEGGDARHAHTHELHRGQTRFPTDRKRILLVLDLNGLLIDRVAIRVGGGADLEAGKYGARSVVGTFYVWERRHVDDFLDFCFDRFDVGVWSSARRENVELLLRHVFGEERTKRLKLFWDQSHCTMVKPGIDKNNPSKPLFLKELSKLWKQHPGYRDGRTLLVDDTPAKARKNPPFTAIHPREWSREMRDDEGLGKGGGVRRYLENLAQAFWASSSSSEEEDFRVDEYVKRNPFNDSDDYQYSSNVLGESGVVRESDDEEEEEVP